MKETELTRWQRVRLECLWNSARLFAVLPYWFKFYVVQNILYFGLHYCLRYRRDVVTQNLRNSFPEKSDTELRAIRRGFYHTLAEVIVDTINKSSMAYPKVRRMLTIRDLEKHREAVDGRDWIAMAAHFGCWEYCSLWGAFDPTQFTVAVYHPLRDAVMECFYQRLRTNEHATAVPMKESLLFYLRHREHGVEGKRLVMGLIADQNPPLRPNSHWFRFLNQDTIFFDGGEKLALRCRLPVYFAAMRRVRPGIYEMEFMQIYDGEEQVAENEITERYVRLLEAEIRKRPELWLWSHRRWKRKRPHADN